MPLKLEGVSNSMNKSLGMIEVYGLVAAIEVADVCVKASDVELLGYEKVNGRGLCMVGFVGDVGAVRAALDSGVQKANELDKLHGQSIIARPSLGVEHLLSNKQMHFPGDKEISTEVKNAISADKIEIPPNDYVRNMPQEKKAKSEKVVSKTTGSQKTSYKKTTNKSTKDIASDTSKDEGAIANEKKPKIESSERKSTDAKPNNKAISNEVSSEEK